MHPTIGFTDLAKPTSYFYAGPSPLVFQAEREEDRAMAKVITAADNYKLKTNKNKNELKESVRIAIDSYQLAFENLKNVLANDQSKACETKIPPLISCEQPGQSG